MTCQLTNLEVLCYILNWSIGSCSKQVAMALDVEPELIDSANAQQMRGLCHRAQMYHISHGPLFFFPDNCK